jgi:biopolymer transport protein ExbD
MLSLSAEMRLELNSRAIDSAELLPLLANLMEQRPRDARTLFIKAPSQIAYEPVVNLIDLAKGSRRSYGRINQGRWMRLKINLRPARI